MLNWPGLYTPLGERYLARGKHLLLLQYAGSTARPGTGGPQSGVGPIVLSRTTDETAVTYTSLRNADSLCGKTLDWIELVER